IAWAIAGVFVASPVVRKTTTVGAREPAPKASSVRWLASYAGLPGTEKLWSQRCETWPAAKAPKRVMAAQTAITSHRRRVKTWARRARFTGGLLFSYGVRRTAYDTRTVYDLSSDRG